MNRANLFARTRRLRAHTSRYHRARLAVELFEDRIPAAESIGPSITIRALAAAGEARLATASAAQQSAPARGEYGLTSARDASVGRTSNGLTLTQHLPLAGGGSAPSPESAPVVDSSFTVLSDGDLEFFSAALHHPNQPAIDPVGGHSASAESPSSRLASVARNSRSLCPTGRICFTVCP